MDRRSEVRGWVSRWKRRDDWENVSLWDGFEVPLGKGTTDPIDRPGCMGRERSMDRSQHEQWRWSGVDTGGESGVRRWTMEEETIMRRFRARFPWMNPCSRCQGSGHVACWACGGTGQYQLWSKTRPCPCCCTKDGAKTLRVEAVDGQLVQVPMGPAGRRPCPSCRELFIYPSPLQAHNDRVDGTIQGRRLADAHPLWGRTR